MNISKEMTMPLYQIPWTIAYHNGLKKWYVERENETCAEWLWLDIDQLGQWLLGNLE